MKLIRPLHPSHIVQPAHFYVPGETWWQERLAYVVQIDRDDYWQLNEQGILEHIPEYQSLYIVWQKHLLSKLKFRFPGVKTTLEKKMEQNFVYCRDNFDRGAEEAF